MNPLTLKDLSANAFRVLGLTASASQAQIDTAARKMRIWPDPAVIPATANDAKWIGPVPRNRQDIENAVARLAEPMSRIEERFWWFCHTPPTSDEPPRFDPQDINSFHDAALVHLYRSLLTNAADDDPDAWKAMMARFARLATSDDYLQWLIEVESAGDFEKQASLDEITKARTRLIPRLSAAVAGAVDYALADGDFISAAKAVRLVNSTSPGGAGSNTGADALSDRMEDDLAARCNQLSEKIDKAWKTKRIAELRPACNHAISRFGTVIRPMIDQLVLATRDVDRQNRAKTLGVNLLVHVAEAYQAFENFMAAERTLETALELAANTPMAFTVTNLLNQVKTPAERQHAGAPRGQREKTPERKEFKMLPGGPMYGDTWQSWFAEIPFRYQIRLIVFIVGALVLLGRIGCSAMDHSNTPTNPIPVYDPSHPSSIGR